MSTDAAALPARGPSSRRRALLVAGAAGAAGAAAAVAWPTLRAGERRRITVAAFPLLDQIVRAALPRWRALQPEVDVQIVSRPYVDHHTAMATALSTASHLPDVMALESTYVGRFSAGGGLLVLSQPPYGADQQRERLVPYAYHTALNARGELVAMPADVGPGTLLYRQDLLHRADIAVDDLTRSWAAYIDAGARLKARTGAYLVSNAHIVKDILIRSDIAPGEGLYFDRDSNVLVTTARFVRAFELARETRRRKLDAKVTAWSNEWAQGFRRGLLATEPSGAWMVGQLATWVAPDTRGLWRAAQLPGGTFVGYGGAFYAIARRAEPAQQALAWQLIRLLTLDPALQIAAFKSQDAFPALVETHGDAFFEQPLPFLGGQPARQLWRDAARRITAVQAHKQNSFAGEVIGTELDNVMDRGKPIAQALGDAARLLQRRAHR